MPRKKKTMIGVDPLAWLNEESESQTVVTESGSNTDEENIMSQSDRDLKSTMLGYEFDESELIKGFERIVPCMQEVEDAVSTYVTGLRSDWEDSEIKEMQAHSMSVIRFIVDHHADEDILLSHIAANKGLFSKVVSADEYSTDNMLAAVKKVVGRGWTKAINAAWSGIVNVVVEHVEDDEHKEKSIDVPEVVDVKTDVPGNRIELHEIQDISRSQALKNELLSLVNENDEIEIDGSRVERIDGTALQLLCALYRYAHSNNISIHWAGCSEALIESANAVGLKQLTGID